MEFTWGYSLGLGLKLGQGLKLGLNIWAWGQNWG